MTTIAITATKTSGIIMRKKRMKILLISLNNTGKLKRPLVRIWDLRSRKNRSKNRGWKGSRKVRQWASLAAVGGGLGVFGSWRQRGCSVRQCQRQRATPLRSAEESCPALTLVRRSELRGLVMRRRKERNQTLIKQPRSLLCNCSSKKCKVISWW